MNAPLFRILALPLLAVLFVATPARADLIYTWHETDSQFVTGTLDVLSASQAQGIILPGDVVNFNFYISTIGTWHYPFDTIADIPISTSDADFTAAPGSPDSYIYSYSAIAEIYIDTNSNNASLGETWHVYSIDGNYTGAGYWGISGASAVPEPASMVLLATGVCGVIAFRRSRIR